MPKFYNKSFNVKAVSCQSSIMSLANGTKPWNKLFMVKACQRGKLWLPAVFLLINQYSTFSWSILSLSWGELSQAYLLPVSPCVFAECGFGCIAGAFVWCLVVCRVGFAWWGFICGWWCVCRGVFGAWSGVCGGPSLRWWVLIFSDNS